MSERFKSIHDSFSSTKSVMTKNENFSIQQYLVHDISVQKLVKDIGMPNPYSAWASGSLWGAFEELDSMFERKLESLEESMEANFSKSVKELVQKSERHKSADKKAKRDISKIEELFQAHDTLLHETVVPMCQDFNELDKEFLLEKAQSV